MLLKTSTHLQVTVSGGLIYQQFQTMPYRSGIFTPSQQKKWGVSGCGRDPKQKCVNVLWASSTEITGSLSWLEQTQRKELILRLTSESCSWKLSIAHPAGLLGIWGQPLVYGPHCVCSLASSTALLKHLKKMANWKAKADAKGWDASPHLVSYSILSWLCAVPFMIQLSL